MTQFLWPLSVVLGVIVMLFVSTAHINTVLSIEQDANTLSSSPQATSKTSIVWPRNVACRVHEAPVFVQSKTWVSSLPEASQLPFDDQAQQVTTFTCFDKDWTRCLAGSSSSFWKSCVDQSRTSLSPPHVANNEPSGFKDTE